MKKIKAVPLTRQQAAKFIDEKHRHHQSVNRDKFRIGAEIDGELVGVIQVGNPVARLLCDGYTVEVVRLCTSGEKNVCSFLYSAASRAAKEMGFRKIVTYILDSESGESLRAAGWIKEADTRGHSWDTPSRPRKTTAPTCNKQRWSRMLQNKEGERRDRVPAPV